MAMTPDKVLRTDMTKNLTPQEAVAVDLNGNVISRADRATIERCYPDHAIFGAADFAELGDGVALTSMAHPETGAPVDENADLNPASLETVEIEVTEEPVTEEPATEEPVTEEPVTEEPVTEEPATEEPATEEPATEEPVTEEPVTEEPVTEEPVTEENPLDHDKDGKSGGSLPKSSRQRKPASN
jgi:hypothetical protein